MTTLLNKLKVMTAAVMALTFFTAVTLSSCTPKEKASEDAESVEVEEASAESEEHPTEGGGEHPSDSTAAGSGEHPEGEGGEEHPEDSEESGEDTSSS